MGSLIVPKKIRLSDEQAQQWISQADSLLFLVQQEASFQGLQQHTKHRVYPDGTTITASINHGRPMVTIQRAPKAVEKREPEFEILVGDIVLSLQDTLELKSFELDKYSTLKIPEWLDASVGFGGLGVDDTNSIYVYSGPYFSKKNKELIGTNLQYAIGRAVTASTGDSMVHTTRYLHYLSNTLTWIWYIENWFGGSASSIADVPARIAATFIPSDSAIHGDYIYVINYAHTYFPDGYDTTYYTQIHLHKFTKEGTELARYKIAEAECFVHDAATIENKYVMGSAFGLLVTSTSVTPWDTETFESETITSETVLETYRYLDEFNRILMQGDDILIVAHESVPKLPNTTLIQSSFVYSISPTMTLNWNLETPDVIWDAATTAEHLFTLASEYSTSETNFVRCYEAATLLWELEITGQLTHIAVSPDEICFITGTEGHIYVVKDGELKNTFQHPESLEYRDVAILAKQVERKRALV